MSKKFALALLLLLSLQLKSFAKDNPALDLSNLPEKTRAELTKKFPKITEPNLDPSELDQILRTLVQQEQYDSAAIVLESGIDKPKLHIVTHKLQRIVGIDFIGVNAISEADLRRDITLAEKSAFDGDRLIETADRIKQIYRELGFYNTQVKFQPTEVSDSDIQVRIVVTENTRTRISEFKVISENEELKNILQRFLKKRLKEPLTDTLITEIRKDSREFFSKNRYLKADLPEPQISLSADESQATVSFTMGNSNKYVVEFSGHQIVSQSSIDHYLNLDEFFSSNPNIAQELAARVKAYYLSEGYARVEIKAEEQDTARAFEKRISLNINEGPRIKIESIEFLGQFSRPVSFYVNYLKENSSERVSKGYFVRESLDQAIDSLLVSRRNEGYLKARIVSKRTVFNREKTKVSIRINLDEGPLTLVQKISFEGANSLSEGDLNAALGLKAQEPLRLNVLEAGLKKLKSTYHDHGYLEMYIRNENEDLVTYSADNTLAHIKVKIYEGPLVKVNSIAIEGNSLTKDDVILKEIEFKVGDTLTPQLIDESTARLQRLGHFNSVEIKTLEERTQVSQRTVVIRVVDRDPGLFNMGIGATNERQFTVRGYAGIAYRNLGGTGRGVSLRVDGNYNVAQVRYLESKVTLGYLEPYLFDTRVRGRVNFTQAKTVTNYELYLASEIKQTTYSLEKDLTSHIVLSWDVWSLARYQDSRIKDTPDNQIYPDSETIDIGSTALNLDVDYRNHPFNTTGGHRTVLGLEYGSPKLGGNETIKFLKGTAGFTHYIPISRDERWVLANSFRSGYLRSLGDPNSLDGVPFDKKGFQLGGQSTIRGFSPSEAFPNAIELGSDKYRLKTDSAMALVKSELRFPLWGNLGGAVFYDGGAVWVWDPGIHIDDPYRDSVGFALRYAFPIGSVNLELGWKLDAKGDRSEDPKSLHFSLATF